MELPLHSSVAFEDPPASPPKASPAVAVPPDPINLLAVFKSPTSDQVAPFQSSFTAVTGGVSPPKAIV